MALERKTDKMLHPGVVGQQARELRDNKLAELDREGWRIVSALPNGNEVHLILERETD